MTATPSNTSSVSVELLVRQRVPAPVIGRIESVLERLEALHDGETIDEYSVKQWPFDGHEIRASTQTRRELVERLEQWAARVGVDLRPAFRRRTVHSSMAGQTRSDEQLIVPLITLVVTEGSRTQWVAPCSKGEHTHTVEHCLQHLESRDEIPAIDDRSEDDGESMVRMTPIRH